MSPTPVKLSLAAALMLGAGPTLAQPVDPDAQAAYQQRLQDYRNQQDEYQAQQQDYENRAAAARARGDVYSVQRDRYAEQRDNYAAERDVYEHERDAYDARYGAGAWARRYGYSYRSATAYRDYAQSPCERRAGSNAAAGGVIGALAGAAIGSNIAGHGDRTAGAVLGAVAGGAVGASIGSRTAGCDGRGYYFTYDQTYPYREAYADRRDSRYDYYVGRRCRMAQAPAYVNGATEYRYVRVCPDRDGRYRITG